MNNSDNIALTNNATSKNATYSNSLLIAYGHKSVELKIIKDTISMYQNSFLEKEKVLKEEKQKLVIAQQKFFIHVFILYIIYIGGICKKNFFIRILQLRE